MLGDRQRAKGPAEIVLSQGEIRDLISFKFNLDRQFRIPKNMVHGMMLTINTCIRPGMVFGMEAYQNGNLWHREIWVMPDNANEVNWIVHTYQWNEPIHVGPGRGGMIAVHTKQAIHTSLSYAVVNLARSAKLKADKRILPQPHYGDW